MTRKTFVIMSSAQFRLMKPIFHLSRIFCLSPLAWTKINGNSYLLKTSIPYLIYSYVVMVMLVGLSLNGLRQLYKIQVVYTIRFASITQRFVAISDICVVLFTAFLGVIVSSIKIKHYHSYFDCIIKIDENLQGYEAKKSQKYLITTFGVMFLTCVILCFDLVIWLNITANQDNKLEILGYYLPYYFCYSFAMVLELAYWHSVYLIKVRIRSMNIYLTEIVANTSNRPQTVRIKRKHINTVIDTLNIAKITQTPIISAMRKPPQLSNIRDLIAAYEKIIEANQILNDSYGFLLLILILGILVHLLATPYALHSIITTTRDYKFIGTQSLWMIGHVMRMIFIVEPCQGCLNETKKSLRLACRILCADLEFKLRKELKMFIVLLENCRIEFDVYGLTKIDRSLLTAVATAVTTYLVILFQFKN